MNAFMYYLNTVFHIKMFDVKNNNKNKELYKSLIGIFTVH